MILDVRSHCVISEHDVAARGAFVAINYPVQYACSVLYIISSSVVIATIFSIICWKSINYPSQAQHYYAL